MAKTFLDLQNLRASKINEVSADKILDVDLARFYNEITADLARYGQKLTKVTTNIVANQSNYDTSVFPGFLASALVSVSGLDYPYIDIDNLPFETDRQSTRHTVISTGIVLLPTPTTAITNGLVVWYWAKLPEIIDAAVAGTPLANLDDRDWDIVTSGIIAKCYEKLLIYFMTHREDLPDASIETFYKLQEFYNKKYQSQLELYGNSSRLYHKPANSHGPALRENDLPTGTGRQNK